MALRTWPERSGVGAFFLDAADSETAGFRQKVRIETWPYDFRGLFGYRNFIMKDEQGECLVRANTLWVYLNTENGRPVRIDEEEKAGYTLESPLDMGEPVRKLSFPENARECPKQYVMLHQLDTTGM